VAKVTIDDYALVSDDKLRYWATMPVGGSGMSVSIQRELKSMANEICIARGLGCQKEKPWHVNRD